MELKEEIMMKNLRLLPLLIGSFMVISCGEEQIPEECLEEIVCTAHLEIFTFQVNDSNGNPTTLDGYYSQNMENGNIYDLSGFFHDFQSGHYAVISDEQLKEIKKNGTIIRFIGEKNGQIAVQEDFLIGHNCCHIVPLQGKGIETN